MPTLLKSTCPHCQATIKVNDTLVGKRVRCPECKQPFEVASVEIASAPADSLDRLPPARQTMDVAASDTKPISIAPLSKDHSGEPNLGQLGRFELHEVLGQGAFGRVYRVYDPQLDRFVALKVPTLGPDEQHKVQRFLAEAKAAAKLRHPNIMPTYESGQVDGQFFIASQFVSGQTLAKRIKQKPVESREAADWVRQLAEALAYAHKEGIVHRDIKPDNIMLGADGVPQIMDFGLAKRLNEDSAMTTDGSIVGTPAYMPPEQARGEISRIGPHSDQYTLGVVLYELLTGKKPFEGPPHSVIAQVIANEPPSPLVVKADVPRDLDAICQKAMSKDACRRYSDCRHFAVDLYRWLGGFETRAHAIGLVERANRWCRRNPAVSVLSGLLTIALILLAVLVIGGIVNVKVGNRDLAMRANSTTDVTRQSESDIPHHSTTAAVPKSIGVPTPGVDNPRLVESPSSSDPTNPNSPRQTSVTDAIAESLPTATQLPTPSIDLPIVNEPMNDPVNVLESATAAEPRPSPNLASASSPPATKATSDAIDITVAGQYAGTVRVNVASTVTLIDPIDRKPFTATVDPEQDVMRFEKQGFKPFTPRLTQLTSEHSAIEVAFVPISNTKKRVPRLSTRQFAVNVLNFGAGSTVEIDTGGQRLTLTNGRNLPPGQLTITAVHFQTPTPTELVAEQAAELAAQAPDLEGLSFYVLPITDDHIASFVLNPRLRGLRRIAMPHAHVTHTALKDLAQFKKLQSIDLEGCKISGAGMSHLGTFSELTYLSIPFTGIKDSDLARLKAPNLRILNLGGNVEVTAVGMAQLRDMKFLESLNVGRIPMGDEGLRHIASLSNLFDLCAEGCGITDAGVAQLEAVVKLNNVSISDNQLTDSAIVSLSRLSGLRSLWALKTRISPGGVERLAAALPQCGIETDHGKLQPRR